jgi:hypothetical protein
VAGGYWPWPCDRSPMSYARPMMGLPKAILDEAGTLFHDTRVEDIDPDAHAPFVMQRVLDRGTLTSVRALLAYYGQDRVREYLVKGGAQRLDPRTTSLWTAYFGLPEVPCTPKYSPPRKSVFWTG